MHQVGGEAAERLPHLRPGAQSRVRGRDPGDRAAAVRRQAGARGDEQHLVAGVDETVGDLPCTVVVVPSTAG